MWTGRVDRNWAKEHHALWLEQIEAARYTAQTVQSEIDPSIERVRE